MRKINSAIRLTESELKSIVCESVKKCLNELRWPTYRNALEKNRDNEGAYRKAFDDLYDTVLLVTADREIRRKRNPKVAQRDALQSFDGSRADFVVENNSDKECLYDKLETLLIKLKQDL